MERILSTNGTSIDVSKRQSVARDDVETHTALFQRDVQGLIHRNPERFREICVTKRIVGETLDELQQGLVALFSNETHYKRRGKLRDQVSRK